MLIHSKSRKETDKLADYLAKKILSAGSRKNAVVLSLIGNLGAGKTHFVKAFMKGLGIKDKIQSPTFNIMKIYRVTVDQRQLKADGKQNTKSKKSRLPRSTSGTRDGKSGFRNAYHIDAYRIKSHDLLKLGFKGIVKDPGNIVLIEWADIVKDILPKGAINIEIEYTAKEGERKIRLT